MDILSGQNYENFVARLIRHIEITHPEKTWSMQEEKLPDRIEKVIKEAQSYGIENENDVAAYVDLNFEFGNEFELAPERFWAREILSDRQMTGHEKIVKLEKIGYAIEDEDYTDD